MSISTETLFDTNAAADLLNQPAAWGPRLGTLAAVVVPVIVIGELFYGEEKSARTIENRTKVENFVRGVRVLPCDVGTAQEFGRVHRMLRLKGRPIPENDMWIAATALQHRLSLVTRDKHFDEVDGLQIVGW